MTDSSAVREYWERKILPWERSRYSPWVAFYPWSWTIRSRLEGAAMAVLERGRSDWRLLELGCGSGHLAARLNGHFQHYTGMDIAANAIAEARKRVPHFNFQACDALASPFPGADLTIFLGLTDWLAPRQLRDLLLGLDSKYILFSFTQPSAWNPYRLYRRVVDAGADHPGLKARSYDLEEMELLLKETGFSYEILARPGVLNPGGLVWAERR